MAAGVRSSSIIRSSLRSISSRRWRIRKRLLSEVINHRNARKRPQPPRLARALVSRAHRSRPCSAVAGEVCLVLCFSHVTFGDRYRLSRSDPAPGFVGLHQRFVCGSQSPEAWQGHDGLLTPLHCWLTNRRNNPTPINSAIRIPTTSEATQCLSTVGFDPAPFCAAPMPNQKRSLSIAVSAVIGAALWQYAYDYGELAHSASAKSPNPDQGYLARRHHER